VFLTSQQQAGRSGKFQAFDWGSPYLNNLHYNQVSILKLKLFTF
jgi:hypothetical protein